MEVVGFIVGTFATGMFFIVAIGAMWFFYTMHNAKYNRHIRINNKTAGKDTVEVYRGRLMKHKTLGDVYHVPALKREDRHYIPFTGKSHEFPMNKRKEFFVPLTFYDGTYAPEQYEHTEEVERDVIIKKYGDLTEDEYFKLDIAEREKNKKLYKVSFHKVKQKVVSYIVKPTKYSMRQFNLNMDTSIKDDFFLNPGFWDKYGGLMVGFGIILISAVVAIVMIVFAYQWAVDLSANQPDWIADILTGLSNNGAIAPENLG